MCNNNNKLSSFKLEQDYMDFITYVIKQNCGSLGKPGEAFYVNTAYLVTHH